MRLVNRKVFLSLPAGVFFSSHYLNTDSSDCGFARKGDSIFDDNGAGIDFFYTPLILDQDSDALDLRNDPQLEEKGYTEEVDVELSYSLSGTTRAGCSLYGDELYYIWDLGDIINLYQILGGEMSRAGNYELPK